jgi:hypothetical protein
LQVLDLTIHLMLLVLVVQIIPSCLADNPGTFTNDLSNRTTDLPRFNRKRFNDTYYIYRSQEIQKYVPGEQDGVYHLVVLNASNKPTVAPFSGQNFSQPVQNLYPQTNRDNPASDPQESVSYAVSNSSWSSCN